MLNSAITFPLMRDLLCISYFTLPILYCFEHFLVKILFTVSYTWPNSERSALVSLETANRPSLIKPDKNVRSRTVPYWNVFWLDETCFVLFDWLRGESSLFSFRKLSSVRSLLIWITTNPIMHINACAVARSRMRSSLFTCSIYSSSEGCSWSTKVFQLRFEVFMK
jgi:hypothetical protein